MLLLLLLRPLMPSTMACAAPLRCCPHSPTHTPTCPQQDVAAWGCLVLWSLPAPYTAAPTADWRCLLKEETCGPGPCAAGQPGAEHFQFKRFLLATRVYMDKGAATRTGAVTTRHKGAGAQAAGGSSARGKGDSGGRPAKKQKQEVGHTGQARMAQG